MSKPITRRDILKFTGGGILGIMFSPLPWKLLDDSAIWTQNWSLTPQLPRGPVTSAFSHCTLCSGGCAIKAQSISGMPYYLTGVPQHPLTHGTLCARGFASHHMAHHPLRITHPHKFAGKSDAGRMVAVSLQEALDELAKQINESHGSIAILDQQPGRAISEIYREFLNSIKNGIYLTSPSHEDGTLIGLKEMINRQTELFGYDIENTKLVLSFGAPLFDGWGIPGQMTAVKNSKNTKFIQIESRHSRTAMQSNQWIPLKPGTEKTVALCIGHVLVNENLVSRQIQSYTADYVQFKNIVRNYTPEKCTSLTDIQPEVIRALARELAAAESAIVLSSADPGGGPFDHETEKAIGALNLLIGTIGKRGGIVTRKEITGTAKLNSNMQWNEIPDHSINVLIVDGAESGYAIPWRLIEGKLNYEKNFVVSLSPVLNEISAHSDYLIPAPAFLESMTDVPSTATSAVATFALSTPLLKKEEGTIEPVEVMKEIATRMNLPMEIPIQEELLKKKVEAIHSQQRGVIFSYVDQSSTPMKEVSSANDFWTKLTEGAIWIDEPARQSQPNRFTLGISPNNKDAASVGLLLIPYGWKGATSYSQVSPILSKVFQESELRDINGTVTINPDTALHLGITKDDIATLSTNAGEQQVRVKVSKSIRPGIIEASVAPLSNDAETPAYPAGNNILNLCEVSTDGTWRITTATLLKV